ncbi:keratin-associated protein 10-10 isoform X4 [Myotis daubentonii]|nr:keratin-associated protein 10-10 isoform X4 [Myotis daubentonii]
MRRGIRERSAAPRVQLLPGALSCPMDAQGCCTDCSSPCRKQGASRPQDCCWTCAEACDFPLPSPAHYLDACCPQPTEAGWAPRCPRCCPLCDCACACQLPDCQSLNCLCFEIKLR